MKDTSKLPKWAQEEFARLQSDIRMAKALRWTCRVDPDVQPPELGSNFNTLHKGFLFNSYNGEAVTACSSSIHHAYGRDDKTTSQNPRSLYSTRLLALRGLRHVVEGECSLKLAKIDEEIEKEGG